MTSTGSSLTEVEGALFEPLFGLVQLLLHLALPGCDCGYSSSRIERAGTWQVLGVVEVGQMGGGKGLKTTTKHHRGVGGNHSGLQSVNSFDQLPHVLVEI